MDKFLNSSMTKVETIVKYGKTLLTDDLNVIKKGVIGDEVDYEELYLPIERNGGDYYYYSFPLTSVKRSYLISENSSYMVSNTYMKILKVISLNDSNNLIIITSNSCEFSYTLAFPNNLNISYTLENITVDGGLYYYNYKINYEGNESISNLKMILYVYSNWFKEKEIKRLNIDFSYLKTQSSGGI